MNTKSYLLGFALVLSSFMGFSQVGLGNTNPQATLDISSSNSSSPSNSDGILIPRVTNFPATNPTAMQDGMLLFYTGTARSGKGFYYWNQSIPDWVFLAAGLVEDNDWHEQGTSTVPDNINDNMFTQGNVGIGEDTPQARLHIDDANTPLRLDIGGTERFSFRNNAIEFHNNGASVFIGDFAGRNDDLSGNQNTAIGNRALRDNVTGARNIAIGSGAMLVSTGGTANVAIGDDAMALSSSGSGNVATGSQTLFRNTTGNNNVAVGGTALRENTTGNNNVALGYRALYNTTGNGNVGIGYETGFTNSSGIRNTFIGTGAGHLTTGGSNVFLGYHAGYNETGSNKLYISNSNTANPLIYGEFDNDIVRINGDVAIGTTNPDTSSALDISSTNSGLLIPRMTVSDRLAISSPATGLMVYQTNDVSGLYFYDGTSWDRMLKESRDPVPTGAIFSFPVQTAPAGYLVCDGSAVSRSTYADLFALIGVTYGNGNGSTTFNLPDYRGKFLRGFDNSAGNDPDAATRTDRGDGTTGDAVGTNQDTAMLSHLHEVNPPAANTNSGGTHNHTVNSLNGTTNSAGNHSHNVTGATVNTNPSGNHSHVIRGREANISFSTNPFGGGGDDFVVDDNGSSGPDSFNTNTTGNHTHTLNIPSRTSTTAGNHNHTVTINGFNTNNSGGHDHTVDIGAFDSQLYGTSSENRPVNITVIYCIKY